MASIKNSLESSFAALVETLGGKEKTVKEWTREFIARYTEPQRHYHTLNHIHAMLDCLNQVRSSVKDETTMKLAIFFHDWIYDPKSKDNEIDSINSFKDFASELGLPDSLSSRAASYIERTITHTLPTEVQEADSDLCLFLDFDLEVLSRSDEEYARYAEQIQAEYSHVELTDYYAGRTKQGTESSSEFGAGNKRLAECFARCSTQLNIPNCMDSSHPYHRGNPLLRWPPLASLRMPNYGYGHCPCERVDEEWWHALG